jgi:hypothetical protein
MAAKKKPSLKSAELPALEGNKQWIHGAQFSPGMIATPGQPMKQGQIDPTHPANRVHMINHKYAHLGLSVPHELGMGAAVPHVQPEGRITAKGEVERYYPRGKNAGQPIGNNITVKDNSVALARSGFNKFFAHPETGHLEDEIQDMDGLRQHPGFQLMVNNVIHEYHKTVARGKEAAALDFYPNENRRIKDVGSRFNEARETKGLQQYYPEKPELAGALLQGGYSQNNTEDRRNKMVEESAATGEVGKHLSTKDINDAIESGTHPLEAFGRKKLRDFTGSILDPHGWNGTHNGVQLGTGHTVDRHVHDTLMGRDFGNIPLKIAGKEQEHRRYRVLQAAVAEANRRLNPTLAPAQFQSMGWSAH